MKNNKYLKVVICSIVYFVSIMIFNYICNLYNMTTLHRILCLILIIVSYTFMQPLLLMFQNNKLKF